MVISRNTSVAPSFYETVGSVPHKLKAGPDCGFKFKSFRIVLCNTNTATARRLKTRMNGWRGGMRGSSSSLPIQLLCLPIPTSTVPLFPPPLFNTVFQFPPHPLIYSAHVVRSSPAGLELSSIPTYPPGSHLPTPSVNCSLIRIQTRPRSSSLHLPTPMCCKLSAHGCTVSLSLVLAAK